MRATSYDPMIILNGSDRETGEVIEFFKEFLVEKQKSGFKFTKQNINEIKRAIKNVSDGDKLTVSFIRKDDETMLGEKYDFIQYDPIADGEFDWDSKDGFEMEGYIAKHCDCDTMSKVGGCEHEVD